MSDYVWMISLTQYFKLLLHQLCQNRRRENAFLINDFHRNLFVREDIGALHYFSESTLAEQSALNIFPIDFVYIRNASHEHSANLFLLI